MKFIKTFSDTAYEFGAWRLKIPKAKVEALVKKNLVHWSPVGVGFVKSSVRRGVLPALLRRILAARQAVKKNMKAQTDENVKKAMHSRQLGNVIHHYLCIIWMYLPKQVNKYSINQSSFFRLNLKLK